MRGTSRFRRSGGARIAGKGLRATLGDLQLGVAAKWTGLSQLLGRTGSFAVALVLLRVLPSREFGILVLALGVLSFLGAVAQAGLGTSARTDLPRVGRGASRLRGQSVAAVLNAAAFAGCAVWVGLMALYPVVNPIVFGGHASWPLFCVLGAAVAASSFGEVGRAVLTGLEDYRGLVASQVPRVAGYVVFATALAAPWSVTGALLGIAIAEALAGTVVMRRLRRVQPMPERVLRLRPGHSLQTIRRSAVTVAAFSSTLVVTMGALGTQAILVHVGGLKAVGIFGVADKVAQLALVVPLALLPAYLPLLARAHASGDRHGFSRVAVVTCASLLGFTAAVALAAALLAPRLLGILGGSAYEAGMVLPLRLMLASSVLCIGNAVFGPICLSLGGVRPWLLSDVLWAALVLAVSAATVADLGAAGLGVAYVAAYGAATVFMAGCALRLFRRTDWPPPAGEEATEGHDHVHLPPSLAVSVVARRSDHALAREVVRALRSRFPTVPVRRHRRGRETEPSIGGGHASVLAVHLSGPLPSEVPRLDLSPDASVLSRQARCAQKRATRAIDYQIMLTTADGSVHPLRKAQVEVRRMRLRRASRHFRWHVSQCVAGSIAAATSAAWTHASPGEPGD